MVGSRAALLRLHRRSLSQLLAVFSLVLTLAVTPLAPGLPASASPAGPCDTPGSLQLCIDATPDGGVANLAAGTWTAGANIGRAITLRGASRATTILVAPTNQRVLTIAGATPFAVHLEHLTIQGGQPVTGGSLQAGGGILSGAGDLYILDCLVRNNVATYGGGFFQTGTPAPTVSIADSRFEGNTAQVHGGGLLAWDGNLLLSNTTIVNNVAGSGAAGSGGGVAVWNGASTIIGGTITGNHATGNGGGVNVNNAVKLQGTVITGNTASGNGGGLLQWNTGQAVAITDATFSGNVATQGGGAWVMGNTLVTGAAFQANHISAGGTGLLAGAGLCLGCASSVVAGPLAIANSTFISNTLTSNGTGLAAGAGLYTGGASTVITGTQFVGNQLTTTNAAAAARGAGAYALKGPLWVTGSRIQGNQVSAAIGASVSTAGGIEADHLPLVSVSGCTFTGNKGWFGGGLSCSYVTKCSVEDSQFDGNQAGYGAGIDASSVEVHRSSFTNNAVINEGAAVGAGSALTLDRTAITNNKAGYSAVWASGAFTLTNVLLANNTYSGNPASAAELKIGNPVWSNRSLKHVTIAAATLKSNAGILIDTSVITAPLQIENTIIANHAFGVNAQGGFVLENYNLYGLNTTNISGPHAGDVGMVYADPRFANPGKGDYHLQAGSPAVNAGTNLGITVDLDGNPRPALGGYDIGAYEMANRLWLPMLLR